MTLRPKVAIYVIMHEGFSDNIQKKPFVPVGVQPGVPYLVKKQLEIHPVENRMQAEIDFNGEPEPVGHYFRYRFVNYPENTEERLKNHPAFNGLYFNAARSGELYWELHNAESASIFIQKNNTSEKTSEEDCARAPKLEPAKTQSVKPKEDRWKPSNKKTKKPQISGPS